MEFVCSTSTGTGSPEKRVYRHPVICNWSTVEKKLLLNLKKISDTTTFFNSIHKK